MRWLLSPLALVLSLGFRLITTVRGSLYDNGWFRSQAVAPNVKVISIGNITAGGTGKTPLTALIARQLQARAQSVGIVSRGYRGTYEGIAKVPATKADAKKFGDEPSWLAQELGAETPVYVGRRRLEAARALAARERVQIVLADDAFQHRRLKRDLDVVIIDATEPLWHYRALPWGRAREPMSALKRADIVVLNKINFLEAAAQKSLQKRLHESVRSDAKIISLSYALTGFSSLTSEGEWPLSTIGELRVLLVSGLGRPESFEALVRVVAGQITGHLAFADHHSYSSDDVVEIEAQARASQAEAIVMTQKDAVKLRGSVFTLPVFVTCLDLQGPGRDQLDKEIRSKIL